METALDFAINHWIYNNTTITITITEDILVVPVLLFALLKLFPDLDWSMLPKHMPKKLMP